MNKLILVIILLSHVIGTGYALAASSHSDATEIVVQLTRSSENFGHRKAFFQIDKVLSEIGEKN